MYPGEEAVPDISAQVLTAECDDDGSACGRSIGKQRHGGLSGELHQYRNAQTEARREQDSVQKRLFCSVGLSCAYILRTESRDCREHGGGYEEEKADDLFHYADGGGITQPALIGDDRDGDKCNLYKPVLRGYRESYPEYAAHRAARRCEIRSAQAHASVSEYDSERDDDADRLRESRAQRRAGRPQMQSAHEYIVKHYIGDAGYRDEIHRTPAVAHAAEDRADDIVSRDKRYADEADREIADGSGYRLLRCGHD